MADYQEYQVWASIAQAIFAFVLLIITYKYLQATKQYAIATDKYVATTEKILDVTANYAETTEEMLNASIIERNIRFYEKRLEKLYMPIYNNQKLFENLPQCFADSSLIAGTTNRFVAEIKPYSYLADDPLRTKLEKLLIESGILGSAEANAKKQSHEYKKLKEDILKQVDDGIKNDRSLLKGMIEEYKLKIRYTQSGRPVVKLSG